MRQRILRAVTSLVIFFFTWTMGGMFNVAYAAYNEIQKTSSNKKHEQRAEEKFQKAMDDLKGIVSNKLSFDTRKSKLREKRDAIESLDKEIKSQFADTENKLKNAGLPQEILQRHHNFVKNYEKNLQELRTNLDAADNAKTDTEFTANADKIRKHLDKASFKRSHKPLDPNKLPHRISDIKRKEPRTKPEEFQKDIKQTAGLVIPAKAGIQENLNNFVTPVADALQVTESGTQSFTVIPQLDWGIQETKNNNRPLVLASNGPLTGLVESLPKFEKQQSLPEPIVLALAHDTPTAANLAETIDVQLTPAIRAKAAELNYSPVKIYNWVRNNVEYVPTYGSIQGADMCLQTLQGNDFDIASLLIALLRASGIHARYVYGTIDLPIDKVMNWVGGFTNANAALSFIASGGTPVAGLISGGKISAVRMEHVWVEAWTGYVPSRGAKQITGQGDSWIPLDASYKQYEYIAPADLKNIISTDMPALAEQLKNSATVSPDGSSATGINAALLQQAMDSAKQELKVHIQNSPDMKVSALTGGKRIISKKLPLLPVTLPYNVTVTGLKMADLNDNFRHKIKIEIPDSYGYETTLSFQAPTASLGNKRITLSYHPTSASDVQTLNSYGGILKTPCYLVNMRPVLKIEGVNKIAGNLNVNPGTEQPLQITLSSPRIGTEIINTKITAGDYKALVFNLGHVSSVELEKQRDAFALLKEKINSEETINADDLIGASLHVTGLNYWMQLEMNNAISANHSGVVRTQLLSVGIFSQDVTVNYLYGVPRSISADGLNVDVKRNLTVTVAKDDDADKARNYVYATGYFSSAMEHSTLEMIHQTQAISAVKAIAEANKRGIPIFKITSANANTILPQLSLDQDAKTDITNALNAGKQVIVPKTGITLNNWSGTGYIIYDPVTGAGAFMIGGLGGAFEIIDGLMNIMQQGVSFVGGIEDDFFEAYARVILNDDLLGDVSEGVGKKLILISVLVDAYKGIRAGLSGGDMASYLLASAALNMLMDTLISVMFQVALSIFVFNPILGAIALAFAVALSILFTYLAAQMLDDLRECLSALFYKIKTMFARLYAEGGMT